MITRPFYRLKYKKIWANGYKDKQTIVFSQKNDAYNWTFDDNNKKCVLNLYQSWISKCQMKHYNERLRNLQQQ